MPDQAILDLPVIDFDLYEGSMPRLHALCIEYYGLAGFRPHPDAVFHFSASLWRYRDRESLTQVVGMSTFFLRALSRQVAARRRVAAVRTAMEDHSGAAMRERLAQADDDLAAAQDDLNDMSHLLEEWIADFSELKRNNPGDTEARMQSNLDSMAAPGWTERLERVAAAFAGLDAPHIDWSAGLEEVLEDIDALALPEIEPVSNGNGSAREDAVSEGLIDRLRRELDEYRLIATRASRRLQQVDRERHDLKQLLNQSQSGSAGRAAALEDARHALDTTLNEARRRLEQLDGDHARELEQARHEIEALRAERDRLAEDLLQSLSTTTDTQVASEELFEQLEESATARDDAAATISSLSRRLEAIQEDADGVVGQNEQLRAQVRELEDLANGLKREYEDAEQRLSQANATIRALEDAAGRNREFEQTLTESEERVLETQRRLQESELRADGLAGELEDRDYQLKKANARIDAQKRTIDGISVQLAETETLTEEHEARIEALERENERLRSDLSDAQGKMLDARGDAEEARETARVAERERERLRDSLQEERNKTSTMSSESAALRRQVSEGEKLREEINDLTSRLDDARRAAAEHDKQLREREQRLEEARDELKRTRAESEEARDELSRARKELEDGRAQREQMQTELQELREHHQRAASELNAARNSASATGAERSQMRARLVELEQRVNESVTSAEAERDLAADRHRKLSERLELAKERARVAEAEAGTLRDALKNAERARKTEREELQRVIEQERGSKGEESAELRRMREELDGLRDKLKESEAYILKHQREFERVQKQLAGILEEVGTIADLRSEYEQADDDQRPAIASRIARRIDGLFATAGKPINADRRTEKVVILPLRKTDEELESESPHPFVATNPGDEESDGKPVAEDEPEAQS